MSTEQNYVTLGKGDLTQDAWGQQVVAQRYSLFHSMFTFDVPLALFRGEENGVEANLLTSTYITSSNGALNINTDGVSGSVTLLESRRHPRYQPNRSHSYSASIWIPVPASAAVQDFGLFTTRNGVFFRCNVDGELYACVMSGGVLTYEEKITLPDDFPDDFDISKGQNYDIQIQWRGVGDYFWYIENPETHVSELVHVARFLGKQTTLTMENPCLPIAYRVTSLGAADGMRSGCADISSSGGNKDREQYGEHSVNRTVTAGTTSGGVLALRNPNLAPNGEINTRDLILARIIITAGGKAEYKVYQTRDATAITGGAWVTSRPGDFVEANTTFTALDYTKLLPPFSSFKPAAGETIIKENPSKDTIDFYGIHGDYLVIACVDGVNIDTQASIEWGIEI